ncbi:MAG: TonB-dependent receptor [Marinilabiliaceae bacterium]|nr:TonB-dependent receptor [Marinilabiliaceae bacterium]
MRISEVVVTGTRTKTDVRHIPMTISIIDNTTLKNQQQPNILSSISEYIPNFFVTSRGMMGYGVSNGAAGGIMLRGISGSAGQLMVIIDGHPQYNGIYGHPIADTYQTMYAMQVEVLRGPASVLYGSNAMGGVINIVTTEQMEDIGSRTNLSLGIGSYGTINSEILYSLKTQKISTTFSGQYMRSDNHRPRMGFEQYGGFYKISIAINDNWKSWTDVNFSRSNSSYPGSTDAPMREADQWINRGFATTAIEHNHSKATGRLSIYTSFGRHKINDGYRIDIDDAQPQKRLFRSKDALAGISIYESLSLFSGNRITFGFDYQHIYGNAYYTSRETGEVITTQNKQSGRAHNNEVAGYIDIRHELVHWLTIDVGSRIDNHSKTGCELIPQAGIAMRPNNSSSLKASISKGFRNPTMKEMFLYPPSNEELEPERLFNYEVAWQQSVNNCFNYGMNIFLIKADNIIQTIERKNVNTGKIENKGIEIEASLLIGNHFLVNTNHSILNMKYPVLGAPEYKGMISTTYNNGNWHARVSLQQISRLFKVIAPEAEKERFTLLNANIRYDFTKHIRLTLRGENLLGQRYEVIKGYPMPKATFVCGLAIQM